MAQVFNFILTVVEGPAGALFMAGTGLLAIAMMFIVWAIVAFQVRWWWGVLSFLFPPTFFVFAYFYPQRAKSPLLITLGLVVLCLSSFVVRAFVHSFFSVPVS